MVKVNPPRQITSKPIGNKKSAPLGINDALITQHAIPINIKTIPTMTALVFGRYLFINALLS